MKLKCTILFKGSIVDFVAIKQLNDFVRAKRKTLAQLLFHTLVTQTSLQGNCQIFLSFLRIYTSLFVQKISEDMVDTKSGERLHLV